MFYENGSKVGVFNLLAWPKSRAPTSTCIYKSTRTTENSTIERVKTCLPLFREQCETGEQI